MRQHNMRVGSLCSGIEAASVAWGPLGFEFEWFSEIEKYPSDVLKILYPSVKNLGDMCQTPDLLSNKKINAPDLICSGTPCQAFSVTGYREGIADDRGQLAVKFVEVIDANDSIRKNEGLNDTILFWENVEGVLSDKTNAFGIMISTLAGLNNVLEKTRWPSAGLLRGPKRNIAWRVIDAKYFGVPQQRKRVYLLGGGKDFHPEKILFEKHKQPFKEYPKSDLKFTKDGTEFEIFREYTDCLYAAYGTKWNGNAAAYNGSLFVAENSRLRRLTPCECEKLMGFPPNYTKIPNSTKNRDITSRYKAIGNSWAVPVIQWIGKRILDESSEWNIDADLSKKYELFLFDSIFRIDNSTTLNCSEMPENPCYGNMKNVVEKCDLEQLYLSPTACHGILRRSAERGLKINARLKEILIAISNTVPMSEIERISRIQPRGEYSLSIENDTTSKVQKNPYNKSNSLKESDDESSTLKEPSVDTVDNFDSLKLSDSKKINKSKQSTLF